MDLCIGRVLVLGEFWLGTGSEDTCANFHHSLMWKQHDKIVHVWMQVEIPGHCSLDCTGTSVTLLKVPSFPRSDHEMNGTALLQQTWLFDSPTKANKVMSLSNLSLINVKV